MNMDNELHEFHEFARAAASPPELGGAGGGLNCQQTADEDGLESWNETPHPQDELPTEVVTMYVVRDYRRMFKSFMRYKKLAELNIGQIKGRALAIASRRKPETQELTELKLKAEEKGRRLEEMYERLQEKDTMISSLKLHCCNQRDQLAVKERSLVAQRQQIQSLLSHIGGEDGRDVLADCDASWSADRWKEAMVNINAVGQQLAELREAVMQQPLDEGVRQALLSVVGIIRNNARRAYNSTARIASNVLRKEFAVDTIPNEEEEQITG